LTKTRLTKKTDNLERKMTIKVQPFFIFLLSHSFSHLIVPVDPHGYSNESASWSDVGDEDVFTNPGKGGDSFTSDDSQEAYTKDGYIKLIERGTGEYDNLSQ